MKSLKDKWNMSKDVSAGLISLNLDLDLDFKYCLAMIVIGWRIGGYLIDT